MSRGTTGGIVTNGLQFYLDADSLLAFNGPAIQNIANQITPSTLSVSANFSFTEGSEEVFIPELGPQQCKFVDMFNNYTPSGACCPSPFTYGTGLAVSGSTQYTFAIVYKSVNRYTHPNYMYHYEYNSGSSFLTEYGVHMVGGYSGVETHLGNDWYWSRAIFTTQATAATINAYAFMYEYSRYNRLYMAKVLIAQGDWRDLHPKYWPNVGTTRSTAQVFVDRARRSTITANSLTYANDGTFSFNGSSNYVSATLASTISMYCLDVWLYNNNAVPNNDTTIGGPSTYQTLIQFNGAYPTGINLGAWTGSMTNEAVQIWTGTASTYTATYNQTAVPAGWHNWVFNWNGSNYDIWIDGAKTTTYNMSGGATLQSLSNLQIGYSSPGYYFNGKIPIVKVYDRQLSDIEVLQNFNAQRKRYGL